MTRMWPPFVFDSDFTHHYLSVGIVFAESIQDDVSRDANHTEDATLRAPADHLHCEGVFLHQIGGSALTRLWFLKHFGGLQLVQHLQCDWVETFFLFLCENIL